MAIDRSALNSVSACGGASLDVADPRLLLNTLNAISTLLAMGRAACADAALNDFAQLLRRALGERPASTITEERDDLLAYLRICDLRFGARLRHRITVDTVCTRGTLVPLGQLIRYLTEPEADFVGTITCRMRASRGVEFLCIVLDGPSNGAIGAAFGAMLFSYEATGAIVRDGMWANRRHVAGVRWPGGTRA